MASYFSYGASSINSLFSSLNNSRTSSGSNNLSSLYSSLSDYKAIRSGAYGKLLTAYYKKQDASSTTAASSNKSNSATSSATSADPAKTLANIESTASELTKTSQELYTRNNNKVFKSNSSGEYDSDAIYEKVSDFVEQYNSLVSTASKSSVNSISNSLATMKNTTSIYESSLNDIGISVDSSNKTLSIDEEKFKAADMSKVKNLFNGTGSYGYNVATQSSMMDSYAQYEATKANTYTNTGSYGATNNIGSLFSDYL